MRSMLRLTVKTSVNFQEPCDDKTKILVNRSPLRCPLSLRTTLCEGLLMELPHWLMVVGALFLVFGLFGLALRRNVQVTSKPNNRDDDAETQGGLPNPPPATATP
jgi:hypothetical protein